MAQRVQNLLIDDLDGGEAEPPCASDSTAPSMRST
jgi:hypothetical protein